MDEKKAANLSAAFCVYR